MNLPTAVHCAACGYELGLDPVAEPEELPCPSCASPFAAIPTEGSGRVLECTSCGGQWVDHASLRTLFERRLRVSTGLDAPIQQLSSPTRVRYLPCPLCTGLMNRRNFGERSGVIVDVCRAHGVWFDPGELPRVLAFVSRGGLEEAARREAEREREYRSKLGEATGRITLIPEPEDQFDGVNRLLDRVFNLLRELGKPVPRL